MWVKIIITVRRLKLYGRQ